MSDYLSKNEVEKFLNSHKSVEKGDYTHTRIPLKRIGIQPGSFNMIGEELDKFYSLYKHHIFEKKGKEYLTERQLTDNGQMAVDLDFRYARDVTHRQHTSEHVTNIVLAYLDELKKMYVFDGNTEFDIFVMEKPNVNLTDGNMTKDGIHILFGLKVDYRIQLLIRENLIHTLAKEIDLPIVNSWKSVLDEGISKGTTGWTLYGSRKPENEAYELTYQWRIKLDPKDNEFVMNDFDVKQFPVMDNFDLLSVRNTTRPKYPLRPEYEVRQRVTKPKAVIQNCEIVDIEEDKWKDLLFNVIGTEKSKIDWHSWIGILGVLKHNKFEKDLWLQWNGKIDLFGSKRDPEKEWENHTWGSKDIDVYALQTIAKKINPDKYEFWLNKYKKTNIGLDDWFSKEQTEKNEALFLTEFDLAMYIYEQLKDRFIYTRRQVFMKHNNVWIYDKEVVEDVLIMEIMKPNYYKLISGYDKVLKREIEVKGAFMNKTIKDAKHIVSLVMVRVRQCGDDSAYNKFIHTTKYKLAFNDGILDIQKKTFTSWEENKDVFTPMKIDRNFKEVFMNQDKYKDACNEIKTKIIMNLFGENTESALLFFSRGLAGCFEDKNWSMFMGNRNSGKGVLDSLIKNSIGSYYSSFDANNLLYERSSGEDKAKKLYWLLALQFVRIAISQEVKTDVKSNLKIDGVIIKAMMSGGDTIKARRNYDIYEREMILTAATMLMFNDMAIVEPADALETCFQYTSVKQFKLQEEIDLLKEKNTDPMIMNKFLVRDDTIKDKCKSVEWGNAFILLLLDSFKEKPMSHVKLNEDSDETDLAFKICDSFTFEDKDSFTTFNELKKWLDYENVNVTIKKLKTELIGFGVKEHKLVGNRGFKGIKLKYKPNGSGDDDTTEVN